MKSNTALRIDVDHHEIVDAPLSPPLKWAGGKRWLAPLILRLYAAHRHRRLVEPFVGGLAIALALRPERALLNDANVHLIGFYRWLQKGLIAAMPMRNDRSAFLAARTRFNSLTKRNEAHSKSAAALFYYLNRTGFNGLCRFNSRGEFNVPFGQYSTINYTRDFTHYRKVLRRWKFSQGDFEELKTERSDFLYVDPPYDVEFTRYSKNDFTWDDQERLIEWLAQARGPVVVSNQATPRILRAYRKAGFKVRTLSAPRLISCTGDRTPAREMLATKNM